MTVLTKEQKILLNEFTYQFDAEFHPNYSGRGMYGKDCIGFSTPYDGYSLAMGLVKFLNDQEQKPASELLEIMMEAGAWSDSMGMNFIHYFRGVTV